MDLISRQAAIQAIKRVIWEKQIAKDAIDAVCNIPSAQPEPSQVARDIATIIENEQDMRVVERNEQPELIRCKDCKYAHLTYEGDCEYCDKWLDDDDFHLTLYLDGDFHCGYAERRTDG